jgi:hypothetical protein
MFGNGVKNRVDGTIKMANDATFEEGDCQRRLGNFQISGGLELTGVMATVLVGMVETVTPTINAASAAKALTTPGGQAPPTIFRHYTDDAGLEGILNSGVINANDRNQVFATERALSSTDAFNELFIGAPTHAGRGDNVIEFTARPGVAFEPGKPGELIHYGSLRPGRHIDITYAGPNPY